MQGVPADSPDGVFIVTALYVLTGVPIAALALGSVANKLIAPLEDIRVHDMINAKFDKDELKMLESLSKDEGDNSFSKHDFLLFSLIRGNIIQLDLVCRRFSYS